MHVHLDPTISQLLGVCNSLRILHERLKHNFLRLTASTSWLESLLWSQGSDFVDLVARIVSDERTAHCERLTVVVALTSDIFEIGRIVHWRDILYDAMTEQESAASHEVSLTSPCLALIPGNDPSTGQSYVYPVEKVLSLVFRRY